MIVFQSSRPIVAFRRRRGSPKGCRKLAGHNIPGRQSNGCLRPEGALEKNPFHLFFHPLYALVPSQSYPRQPGYFAKLLQDGCQGFPRLLPRLFQPIQGVPSLSKPFFRKKDCLFFARLFSLPFMTTNPANPHRKSTAASPKSTVDLGCQLLIWVKSSLPTPLLPGGSAFISHNNDAGMEACRPKTDRNRPKNFHALIPEGCVFRFAGVPKIIYGIRLTFIKKHE